MNTPTPSPFLYTHTHFKKASLQEIRTLKIKLQPCALPVGDHPQKPPPPLTPGGCTTMNNVTGRGGGHWACVPREKKIVPPPPLPPPSLSILLPCSPNPLAAGCTAEGQREKKRREAEGEAGVRRSDVHEHADRRAFGWAMTAMLSPKIRQTRRGRTWSVCSVTRRVISDWDQWMCWWCSAFIKNRFTKVYFILINRQKHFSQLFSFHYYNHTFLNEAAGLPTHDSSGVHHHSTTAGRRRRCEFCYEERAASLVSSLQRSALTAAAVCSHSCICTVCAAAWMY